MRKITKVLLALTLFFNYFAFGQTITVTPTSVGNSSISNGAPINLGTAESTDVALSVSMKLPSPTESDSNPGTIDIYYQRNSSYPPQVAQGGYGGALFFGGGTFAVRGFVVTFRSVQFDATGGYLYAQYKTSTGIIYKSANIPIIKNSTTPGGGTITPVPIPTPQNPRFASQTIPYKGIPLLPKLESNQKWVENLSITSLPRYFEFVNGSVSRNKFLYVQTTLPDGTTKLEPEPKRMSIIVEDFLPIFNNGYQFVNVNNTISKDDYVPVGQSPKTIIGNQASETHKVGVGRDSGTVTNLLNNYQWQIRVDIYSPFSFSVFKYHIVDYGWKDIPGATQINYTPQSFPYGVEYRRLVIETSSATKRNSATSNIVGVYPLGNTFNLSGFSICCDQTISSIATIRPIVGEITNGAGTENYLWQLSSDGNSWINIENSNSKDYQPVIRDLSTGFGGRDGVITLQSKFFRRIKSFYYSGIKYFISNSIKVTVNNTAKTSVDKTIVNNITEDAIVLSPNPSSSFLKVESKSDLASSKVTIVDLSGKILELQSEINKDTNSLQIDISKLSNGVYSLVIENADGKQAKKFIKE
jgi:Secretion system C-terminal sorting domain